MTEYIEKIIEEVEQAEALWDCIGTLAAASVVEEMGLGE